MQTSIKINAFIRLLYEQLDPPPSNDDDDNKQTAHQVRAKYFNPITKKNQNGLYSIDDLHSNSIAEEVCFIHSSYLLLKKLVINVICFSRGL